MAVPFRFRSRLPKAPSMVRALQSSTRLPHIERPAPPISPRDRSGRTQCMRQLGGATRTGGARFPAHSGGSPCWRLRSCFSLAELSACSSLVCWLPQRRSRSPCGEPCQPNLCRPLHTPCLPGRTASGLAAHRSPRGGLTLRDPPNAPAGSGVPSSHPGAGASRRSRRLGTDGTPHPARDSW